MEFAKQVEGAWVTCSLPKVLTEGNKIICNPQPQHMIDNGYIEFDSTIPAGQKADGYKVVKGKLKYKLTAIETPVKQYPNDWLYPDRHIRITLPKPLCKRGGDYFDLIAEMYLEGVPFIKDDNKNTVTAYFKEVNTSDGFTLKGTEIQNPDTRLIIESFGEFEVINNVIVSI